MQHAITRAPDERVNWVSSIPFFIIHLLPFAAIFTGVKMIDVATCIFLYYIRMFFVTAGYHRYFAHRSYKMGRVMQFIMAFGATTAMQKGPLWWAAHHRNHHKYSDTPQDVHSPQKGFWWSHVGWILCDKYSDTEVDQIQDFAKYPELRWLNKYNWVGPWLLGAVVFLTLGASGLFIGFFLSTVLLWHGTFIVNSLAHVFGRRRFVTLDTSRNSFLISLFTCGEGWHNNHHYYQSSAKQGFFWWEFDPSYYVLKSLSWVGLVSDLRKPPQRALYKERIKEGNFDLGMFGAQWAKATQALSQAQKHAQEFAGAKKRAVDGFVDSAKKTADDLALMAQSKKSPPLGLQED